MASKKVLSIELGVQTTRICEIEYNGKKKIIKNTCVFDTPEGTVEDGYIRNKEILAVSLKAAMQKKVMNAKEVIFSISSSKIANREVSMPFIQDNKIPDFIQTNAKEYFPVEIEKYVITYKKLEEIKEAEAKKLRILVLAAPNDLIETYYDLASVMDVQINAIDYAGNSSYQVLKRQNIRGVNVIVQLNETNTLINIMKGSVLLLQRTVPYGVSSIVDAAIRCGEFDIIDKTSAMEKLLSDTLVNPKLNESAIDDVALSYMDSNNDAYSQQIKQMKAKDQITDAFNYLVNNTIRVLDYYASKFPDEKVDNIYLAGIGCRIKGILPLFKNEVFKEIKKLDNIVGIEFGKNIGITNEEKSDYIVACGACLDYVDFVPKQYAEDLKNKKVDVLANRIAIGLAIVGAAVFVWYLGGYLINFTAKQGLNAQIKNYADVEQLLEDIEKKEVEYGNAKNIFVNSMTAGYVLNVLFEEVEKTIPTKTTVTSFEYSESGVKMEVESSSLEETGEFVQGLKDCALVDGVAMEGVDISELEGGTVYSYDVELLLKSVDYEVFIDKEVTPSEESICEMFGIKNDDGESEEESEDESEEESEDE